MRRRLGRLRTATRNWIVRSHRLRRRLTTDRTLTVFMYHDVTDAATRSWGPWRYAVTPDSFANDIERIAANYTVVTMDEVLTILDSADRQLPARAAVVTFDDGYENTLTEAVPILDQHDVPATVYVSTGLIGSPGPFAHRLATALMTVDPARIDLTGLGVGLPQDLPSDHRRAYELIRRELKWASSDTRTTVLEAIEPDEGPSPAPIVTESQLSRLATHPLITVGAHGHAHVPLTTLSESQLRTDLETTRQLLTDLTGRTPRHFSYPYGAQDEAVRKAVRQTGFETAVTTHPRVLTAGRLPSHRFVVPRINAALHGV